MNNILNLREVEKKKVVKFDHKVSDMPLLSVCVQTYQHVHYIKHCLDGILMQKTNFDFEILLGEDESTDGTRSICLKYAENFPDKIRLFLHSRENVIFINNKPTGKFNFLYNLNNTKGKYIAICEGDDYWTDPLKLQKQYDFLEQNPGYSMCFHEAEIVDKYENFISKYNNINFDKDFTIEDLTQKNFISTASAVFRRKNIEDLPEFFLKLKASDWGINFFNAKNGKIKYFNESMSAYRQHENSVWSSLPHKEMIIKGVELMKQLDEMLDYEYHSAFKRGVKERLRLIRKENKIEKLIQQIKNKIRLRTRIKKILNG